MNKKDKKIGKIAKAVLKKKKKRQQYIHQKSQDLVSGHGQSNNSGQGGMG